MPCFSYSLQVLEESARNILQLTPDPLPIEPISAKYPVKYEESMNTVLVQEVFRYNKLLATIKSSLRDLLKALKGLVVMSQQLETMSEKVFNNQVPELWASKVKYCFALKVALTTNAYFKTQNGR